MLPENAAADPADSGAAQRVGRGQGAGAAPSVQEASAAAPSPTRTTRATVSQGGLLYTMSDLERNRARLLLDPDDDREKAIRVAAMRSARDILHVIEGDIATLRNVAERAAKEHYVNPQTARIKYEIDDMRRAFSNAIRLAETGEL